MLHRMSLALRGFTDPLAGLWRLLVSRQVLVILLLATNLLLLSIFIFPTLYVPTQSALGLPLEFWPRRFSILTGIIHSGSTIWGRVLLATLAVVALAKASDHLGRALRPRDAITFHGPLHRDIHILYSERSPVAIERRLRIALALLGYRWHKRVEPTGARLVEAGTTRMAALATSMLALAALAILALLATRLSLSEVILLDSKEIVTSAIYPGLSLKASIPESAELTLRDERTGQAEAYLIKPGHPIVMRGNIRAWCHSGPALAIEATVTSNSQLLLIPFLPGETSKYVTLPGRNLSLRLTLERGRIQPTFVLQTITSEGEAVATPVQITRDALVGLGDAHLQINPSTYLLVSLLRFPLLVPVLVFLLILILSLLLSFLAGGRSLIFSFKSGESVTSIQLEVLPRPLGHRWALLITNFLCR